MTMSMYQASVPVCIKMLINLRGILEKAAAHAQSRKIDDTAFIEARLFPDMLPVRNQAQISTDMAKSLTRLGGVEPPSFDGTERSFSELIDRVTRTVDVLATLDPAQIDGSENREITRQVRGKPKTFNGIGYLQQFL